MPIFLLFLLSLPALRAAPPAPPDCSPQLLSARICAALAARDPGRCDAKPRLGAKEARVCRNFYFQGLFAREAAGRKPGADAACREMFARERGAISSEAGASACKALLGGDVPAACAALRSGLRPTAEFSLDTCEFDLAMFTGGADCARAPSDASDFCRGVAALKAPKECGREPFCAALTGRGQAACAPLAARLKTLGCGKP
jgi:hypothetical protein